MAESSWAESRVLKTKRKRGFQILASVRELERLLDHLPEEDEIYKFLSGGGFSSASFVRFVGKRAHIHRLTATTLRVGKKEIESLNALKVSGRLDEAQFLIGSFMRKDSAQGLSYGYYQIFKQICQRHGWKFAVAQNHSKVLLFDTDQGKYVLETSSNLNENPKMEQFSFEKSDALYDFYFAVFDRLIREGDISARENEESGNHDQESDPGGKGRKGAGRGRLPAWAVADDGAGEPEG